MVRPVIGITSSLKRDQQGNASQTLDGHYPEAVAKAGGSPLILPMMTEREALQPVLERIDGLLITGGPGIVEGLVGALPEDLPPVDERRARADSLAFELAQEEQKPVLGICYGMQFINARLGGTIYGDVQKQLEKKAHSPGRNGGQRVDHDIDLVPDTHLAALVDGVRRTQVNSFHIQAVEHIGQGLKINSRSEDGLVEGIESADGRIMGVQFHPERMPGSVWDGIFTHLVAQAGG